MQCMDTSASSHHRAGRLAKLETADALRYLKDVGKSALKTTPQVFLLALLIWIAPDFITKLTHEQQLFSVVAIIVVALMAGIFQTFRQSMKLYSYSRVRSASARPSSSMGMATLIGLDDLSEERTRLIHRFRDKDFAEYMLARSDPGWTTKQLMEHALESHPAWLKSNELPARIDVAHHEAGHALLAHLNELTVLRVTSRPKGFTAGRCEYYANPVTRPAKEVVWAKLKTALAGQAVDHARGIRDAGSASDMQSCFAHAYSLISIGEKPDGYEGDLTTDALIATAREIADAAVKQHMDTVSGLAEQIALRGALNGREVRLFLESRLPQLTGCSGAINLEKLAGQKEGS